MAGNGNPSWVKGVSGNPGGRPKGSKSKHTLLCEAERIALAQRVGITPLEFLMSVLRDPEASMEYKIEAARTALPYMHQKMPVQVQNIGDPSDSVQIVRELLSALFASPPTSS